MVARAPRLRDRILDVMRDSARSLGLQHTGSSWTTDEMAEHLGESALAIRPRFTELHVDGLAERTGERRPSSTGHLQWAYRIARKEGQQ